MSMPDEIWAGVEDYPVTEGGAKYWTDSYSGDEIKYHSDAKYKALEAKIDELLEQQREACFMAYLDSDAYAPTVQYSLLIADAIRNARIEK